MKPDPNSKTAERILFHLKTKGPKETAWLAKKLDVTPMAIRQQLKAMEADGLVTFDEDRKGVGRPARVWRTTRRADERFPDAHGDLTLDLIESVRDAFGGPGLEKLIETRTTRQAATYARHMPPPTAPLAKRVAALAKRRDAEGYLAEWSRTKDGFRLIENHCPICVAAEACQGLCAGELRLFESALGGDVTVERTEHLLDGARRCVYRITPRQAR